MSLADEIEIIKEDAQERADYERTVSALYHGDRIAAIADALATMTCGLPSQGTMAKLLAIFANDLRRHNAGMETETEKVSTLDRIDQEMLDTIRVPQLSLEEQNALPEGDQRTPGTRLWYGVHRTHCCKEHGCKYRNDDCPVANGRIKQSGPCEECGLEREGFYGEEVRMAAIRKDQIRESLEGGR